MLSSCKSYERVRTVHVKPRVPQVVLQECPVLSSPKNISSAAVYAWGIDTVQKYRLCKARHRSLVELVTHEVEPVETLEPLSPKSGRVLKN